ncbi:MAG: hypothetical protein EOO45_03735 [Flavobacterium sp.]|nr:MAG: hypothetical protein EOO45_03735 [Flavobacterium sp.]
MACLGSPPPRGSKLFLDKKFNKNQGLDLLSDKLVKALISATQVPMKDRKGRVALGFARLKGLCKSF